MKVTNTPVVADIPNAVLAWSEKKLSTWQQDALRRVVVGESLSAGEIEELVELSIRELDPDATDELQCVPLGSSHIPQNKVGGRMTRLSSISGIRNVNALDGDQQLDFGLDGITVVFGYNGSGKSGYGRLLRRVCRSRTRGARIEPDFRNPTTDPPEAEFEFCEEDAVSKVHWVDGVKSVPELTAVSFFDAECALQHVREKNAIDFVPFGLDWLTKLAAICDDVQRALKLRKKSVENRRPAFLDSPTATGQTAVGKFCRGLTRNTVVDQAAEIAGLSAAEEKRLEQLRAELATDPKQLANVLSQRSERLQRFKKHLGHASVECSDEQVGQLLKLAEEAEVSRRTAEAAATQSFSAEPLEGVGEAVWRRLWEAAREFSVVALPGQDFPVVQGEGAVCVLCQQELDGAARERLTRFEQFVKDTTSVEAEKAESRLASAVQAFSKIDLSDERIEQPLADLRDESPDVAELIEQVVGLLRQRRVWVQSCHESGKWDSAIPSSGASPLARLDQVLIDIQSRVAAFQSEAVSEERQALHVENEELEARKWFQEVVADIKNYVLSLRELHLLDECIASTNTAKITKQSDKLATQFTTDRLRDAFASEIRELEAGVGPLNVELSKARASKGEPQTQIRLVGNQKVDVSKIVSEGEHRCIALAGFLAELAMDETKSAIVFDDPVTSLDQRWRLCFAERLVQVSAERQVVVFTHDTVFLHELQELANREGTPLTLKHVKSYDIKAGFVSDKLPGDLENPLERIKGFRERITDLERNVWKKDDEAYCKAVYDVYDELRSTIERAVERHALCNVVQRHQPYINLKELKLVVELTEDSVNCLQSLFKTCCNVTTAHDTPIAAGLRLRSPDKVKGDITELQNVVEEIEAAKKLARKNSGV